MALACRVNIAWSALYQANHELLKPPIFCQFWKSEHPWHHFKAWVTEYFSLCKACHFCKEKGSYTLKINNTLLALDNPFLGVNNFLSLTTPLAVWTFQFDRMSLTLILMMKKLFQFFLKFQNFDFRDFRNFSLEQNLFENSFSQLHDVFIIFGCLSPTNLNKSPKYFVDFLQFW